MTTLFDFGLVGLGAAEIFLNVADHDFSAIGLDRDEKSSRFNL